MAIFSRRVIQQWLNENLQCVGRTATIGQVKRLNDRKNPRNVIGAVWETAIIFALRQFGNLRHEEAVGIGSNRPDVFFQSKDGSLEFVADIATVSDDGLHDRSWVTELFLGLMRLKKKHGIAHLGIRTEIGRITEGAYGDSVVRAAVPSKQQREAFLKRHFDPFLRQIASSQHSCHNLEIKKDGIEVRAIYDPENARFGGGSFPGYTTAYSLTNNPIFNRLSEKREQLKKSGFKGLCGVILCDGGCETLHRTEYAGPSAYSLDQIVTHFLESTQSVHFVLSLGHEMRPGVGAASAHSHELIPKLFLGRTLAGRRPEFEFLQNLPRVLPPPIQTPSNAFPKYVYGKPQLMPTGEYRVSGYKVAINVEDLVGLLGGAIKQDDWLHDHVFSPEALPVDQIPKVLTRPALEFRARFEEGRELIAVRILKRDNNDHDLVEFEFGEIDPALGKFQVPPEGND